MHFSTRLLLPLWFSLGSLAAGQERPAPAAPLVTELAVSPDAEAAPKRPAPMVVELAVSLAAEPTPALKQRLLPGYLDRTDENAAPIYYRALLMIENAEGAAAEADPKLWEMIIDWAATDPKKLPRDEVRKTLDRFSAARGELQFAARRAQCDWALGVRDRREIYATLLPEVQEIRNLARLTALEVRLHIAERDFPAAIKSLQVGYTLARHVTEQPFLISGLVGASIAQQMNDQLEALIAAEGSPNMYWAIAALPDPLIDLRPSLEVEGNSLFIMFPQLRDVRERKLTPDEWRQEFRDAVRSAAGLLSLAEMGKEKGLGGIAKDLARAAALEALLELRYPAARKELLAWGYDEKRLDAMAKGQAVLVHEVEYFERTRDDLFKWFNLPYWQAFEPLQAADAAFTKRAAKRDKLTPPALADVVLPAMKTVYNSQSRGARRLAALQAVEALRMYAAAHEGRWPPALADAALRPLPLNPYTGKLPDYAEAEGIATLTFAGLGTEADLVYKLRIRK